MNDMASPRSNINVTPYIDILLVLLIIFMVIQPTRQYDLKTRTPDPAQSEGDAPAARIVVTIDEDFRMAVNGRDVTLPELGSRLFEILRTRSDRTLFVLGSQDLPFGSVARVIDIAKGAGAGDVGLGRLELVDFVD